MNTPADAALWFLVAALPISLWVILTDMRSMRIPNVAVLALVAAFAVIGYLKLPLEDWAWRWSHLGVMLVAGFLLNQFGAMGAGDAKFLAASAPFYALGDYMDFLLLFAIAIPLTFGLHRGLRSIPAVRRATSEWVSWARPTDFPMALPLAGTLLAYLLIAANA